MATIVDIHWNEVEYERFRSDPTGPLGVHLFDILAQIVLAGAKRRALVKSGNMRDEMTYKLGRDEYGLYALIISPVKSKTGFPYATVHEGKHVRDRRPHRSLKPALADVRKILKP